MTRLEKYLKEREAMRSEIDMVFTLQSISDRLDRLIILMDEQRLEGLKTNESAEIFDSMMGNPKEWLEDLMK